ncbi:MAG TPA: tetratricopeptide repeat protein, partial [Candidatus Methylacidiphilales bacterium]|nr:tetratricopeptide repeat protein [Candidatus Methylacidiphilales bacterium]
MARRFRKKNVVDQSDSARQMAGTAFFSSLPPWFRHDWILGLILILAVILTYSPVWEAGFIWDDDLNLTANPCIVGPLGLKEIWSTRAADICPLVFTTFWVEHALWGLAPLPYHLANVVLHAACAIVLWQVWQNLKVPGAWLCATLWALHPLQVETVAWVSELKNTQACLFYLLSVLFYIKWLRAKENGRRSQNGRSYAWALFFAVLALASKSSTVILPGVLCLCAWWIEGRWQWRNLLRVAPVFVLSIAAGLVSMWTRGELHGDNDTGWVRSWPERIAAAGEVVWFYAGKVLWPHPLINSYPSWEIDARQWISYFPSLTVIAILLILWVKRESWFRPFFFVFAYFLIALVPVLGFVTMGSTAHCLVADHLQYLAGMGPLALAGAGLAGLLNHIFSRERWAQGGLVTGILLVLGIWSWQRCWAYESEVTIWTDTLSKNPACLAGYNDLGTALLDGHVDEAIGQFKKLLAINPGDAQGHNNLGNALFRKGRLDDAIAEFQKALAIKPGYPEARTNLGNALVQKGRIDEAVNEFQKALETDPHYVLALYSFGNVLAQREQMDQAMAQYQKILEVNPNFAEAYNSMGNVFLQIGQIDKAMAEYQAALKIDPDYAEAHTNLGDVLIQKGRVDEAMNQF